MKFVATIECDNAAFDEFNEGDLHSETGDILYKLANKIKNGHSACYLNDSNGNKVGYAEFIKEEEKVERIPVAYQHRYRNSQLSAWSEWTQCEKYLFDEISIRTDKGLKNEEVRELFL